MVNLPHGSARSIVLEKHEEIARYRHIPRVRAHPQHFENKRVLYYLLIPFLYITGAYVHVKSLLAEMLGITIHTNVWYVDGISINSRRVKEGAARWPALDTVYNFHASGAEGSNALVRWVDDMWLHVRNAQAVRNRLKIAKHELRKAIITVQRGHRKEPARVLSLAAGSAQGVLEVVAELSKDGIEVEVLLVDQDLSALSYALTLAKHLNIHDRVRAEEGDIVFFTKVTRDYEPDIIEMLGLLDYFRTSMAIKLIRKIWSKLPPNGLFLTCHVHPNHEAYFLDHVVDWKMLYRTRGELEDILTEGRFVGGIRFITEPQGIHTVAVARKVV